MELRVQEVDEHHQESYRNHYSTPANLTLYYLSIIQVTDISNHVYVRTRSPPAFVGREDSCCRAGDGYGDGHVQQVFPPHYVRLRNIVAYALQTPTSLHEEVYSTRLPRRRAQQGRISVHRPLRQQVLRRADEDLGDLTSRGGGERRWRWDWRVWWWDVRTYSKDHGMVGVGICLIYWARVYDMMLRLRCDGSFVYHRC